MDALTVRKNVLSVSAASVASAWALVGMPGVGVGVRRLALHPPFGRIAIAFVDHALSGQIELQ
jgi:hypothetical protein